MKEIIRSYIVKEFGGDLLPDQRTAHYSYCSFPFEGCVCRDISEINYNTSMIGGGYLDSFSMVDVLVFVETKFNVRIPDKEATPDNFDTINKIVELIKKHL